MLDHVDASVLDNSPEALAIEVRSLQSLCACLEAIPRDAKATSLLDALETLVGDRQEKVLIFTQFKETLTFLQRLLGERYRVQIFHGDMDAFEKDEAVDAFRDPDGAQVMVATEAAGEGRNLQFCHTMFNYDLPWNPMKIEQRIGRLDRIGQRHPVEIFNFSIEDTLEDRVLEVLHDRIRIFETTVGGLDPILGDIEREVRALLLWPRRAEDRDVATFEEALTQRVRDAQEMEDRLTDFILDARSFRRDRADSLLSRTPAFTGVDLQAFMARFLAYGYGEMHERAAGIFDILPTRRMREETGLGIEIDDHYAATFDPKLAQEHDRLDFIAFGHPLLDSAVAICSRDGFGGKTAAVTVASDDVPPVAGLSAVYEFAFDGIRPRKQLHTIAVAFDGTLLPDLAGRFPALALRAEAMKPDDPARASFDEAIEHCIEIAEEAMGADLERERKRRDEQNGRDYTLERRKRQHFYAVKLESAQREVERLAATVREQQASDDPNVRRVARATQGRLAVAERTVADLQRERESRLRELDARQSVSAHANLVGAALVAVRPQATDGSLYVNLPGG